MTEIVMDKVATLSLQTDSIKALGLEIPDEPVGRYRVLSQLANLMVKRRYRFDTAVRHLMAKQPPASSP